MRSLPVDAVVPDVLAALEREGVAVLQAPPGTGKTTRVPPAIARAREGRVVVLEPRRVAARASARRVASEWGCAVGEAIGYQVRGDKKVGPDTRVVFMTEGVFLRIATSDPFLEGIGTVVLDEFHERSVDADLAIALARSIRQGLRDDLAILAMSATLDAEPVAQYLQAPIVTATAPLHPLEVRYDPRPDDRRLEDRVVAALAEVPREHDVLVFLPGLREIRRAAERIQGPTQILHGRLTPREQDAVLRRSDRPRVILSTNVAESSVTVPGVRVVIDSGLARFSRKDDQTGLDRLLLGPIARDAAEQRAGRAAREGPGVVRRLWTARDHRDRPAHTEPSIHRTDLTPTVLQLLAFGEPDPHAFPWFDPPEARALDDALKLLRLLGALEDGLTPVGAQLARMPLHPRLARFVLEADRRGAGRKAARIALWMGDGGRPEGELCKVQPPEHREASRLARTDRPEPDALERAALAGWPDRLAKQRGTGAVMVGGTGLVGGHHPLFTALSVHPSKRGERGEWTVTLQSYVDPTWLDKHTRITTHFDGERVTAQREECVGELVLKRHPAPLDKGEGAEVLFRAVRERLPDLLPDDRDLHELLGRLRFLARVRPHPELPDASPTSLEPVLERLCHGRTTVSALRKAPWRSTLLDQLPWAARQHLDREAPERVKLASGFQARLTYREKDEPILAVRIQQLMGTATTPVVGGQPVLLHLLAPNNRPQQITRDLKGFWASTYFDVRKDLRRRYPKHAWPDDPLQVPPPRRRRS